MHSARAIGWAAAPWFLVTPPQRPAHVVDRPRLAALLDDLVPHRRVTLVTAPAGFGKTTALGDWARNRPDCTAWLSLTRFDRHDAHLVVGVVSALRRSAREADDLRAAPLLALGPDTGPVEAQYGAVVRALEAVPSPTTLVVDDSHLIGPGLANGIVGFLAAHAPASFHMVLAGREVPALPLQRLRLAGQLGEIAADDLAFTAEEVLQASDALDRPVPPQVAESITADVGGWPAAVRMALVSAPSRTAGAAVGWAEPVADTALADYVSEEILAGLGPELADFVLAATTCGTVDGALAATLTGLSTSGALLEECRRRGLFLDRFTDGDCDPVYRWHPVFAAQCHTVLTRRDPERADRLHRDAARGLAGRDPLRAVVHARRGHDPELALLLIEEHWLELVLRNDADAVEGLCSALPPPWADTPTALLVRACCRDVLHDRPTAATLSARAVAEAERTGVARSTRFVAAKALAELFLADEYRDLATACDRVAALLRGSSGWGPATHACVTFLLGWTELRLRRGPAAAAAILRTAEWECRVSGQEVVRRRAAANLAFALAFSGALNEARAVLDPAVAAASAGDGWTSADAGVEWLTDGFLAYWSDDLDRAARSLRIASECTDDPQSFAALARVYQVFTAVAAGDPDAQAAAGRGLRAVADDEAHGVPWHVYQRVARAMLDLAAGRADLARAVLRGLGDTASAPVSAVLAAQVLRRCGNREGALERLGPLPLPGSASYVAASALLVRGLAEHRDGPRPALHAVLEQALAVAAPEGVVRPFADPDPLLQEVLADHVRWGTRYQQFLAVCLAHLEASALRRRRGGPVLSAREREVLEYLRTPMTVEDIAKALFVSVNTVKTHQRAVYRKLGVSNRREAIRAVR